MKTFKDLKFEAHELPGCFDTHAKMNFKNGFGVSVVTGKDAFQDNGTYELAVMENGHLCYTTSITNDILSYQTPRQITAIMKKLQKMDGGK